MMKDASPATYSLIWLIPLPAEGLIAVANLEGNTSTIKWSTESEQNTSYFIVERSLDNRTYTVIGNPVQAAGTSSSKREYQLKDDISNLLQNNTTIFYKVKLVDIDDRAKYSNVVVVKLEQKLQVSVWPNPFQSFVTVNITADKTTTYNVRVRDISGRLVKQTMHTAAKGVSQFTLRDFDKLPGGTYLLEMTDERSGSTTVQKLIKN
jgi:hypothetical protein